MKEGNIFPAAAGSGLIGVIAPTDEEFTVIDADYDRFPPSGQIILLVKGRRENQRTRLELPPQIDGNCCRCGFRFGAASRSSSLACCGFE
ncbi:MAG TPA: hypothetical protein VIE66_14610 [Methylocella sp.]